MYLIWSILNVVIYLYFLYLIVGYVSIGRKVLPKNRFRPLAAILLIVGVVQLFKNDNQDFKSEKFTITELPKGLTKKEINNYKAPMNFITLEEHIPFSIVTLINNGFINGEYVALNNRSSLNGFLSGFVWKQTSAPLIYFNNKGIAIYKIHGLLKWELMGITIYSQSKAFEGTYVLDNYRKQEEYNTNKKRKEQQLVLGKWGNEEDSRIVWEFTENNTCNWYTASKLSDSFNCSLSKEPLQCGFKVRKEKDDKFTYLKLTDLDEDKDEYCYEVFGVNDSILSINYLPTSKIYLFKRLEN